ncbi:MAG: hypothetical protein JWO05_1118 [Gemmatimonadetes bacterium]|nr:hypothetical protein [Gemmatimonadota bacterium]
MQYPLMGALPPKARRCTVCSTSLDTTPESLACPTCGVPMTPPHEAWPQHLKRFLAAEAIASRFPTHKPAQLVWDDLLRDTVNGVRAGAAQPNPTGLRHNVTPGAVFQRVSELADAWHAAGEPIAR